MKPQSKLYKVITLSDLHCPNEDSRSLSAVLSYAKEHVWDECIIMGDLIDAYSVSTYVDGKPKLLNGKELSKEYDHTNKVLDSIQWAVRFRNKKTKITYLFGNHENRVKRFRDKFPQLEGLIEPETRLHLKDRGIKVVYSYPEGDVHIIGKAYFHHGLYEGPLASRKHVENFGVNLFHGHTHSISTHYKSQLGTGAAIVGQGLGCLCEYEQEYLGKNPTAWKQGFGIFYFETNGDFTYYVPQINNHSFISPEGKRYA